MSCVIVYGVERYLVVIWGRYCKGGEENRVGIEWFVFVVVVEIRDGLRGCRELEVFVIVFFIVF